MTKRNGTSPKANTSRHHLFPTGPRLAPQRIAGYKRVGAAALASKKRGRPGPRRFPEAVKRQALDLIRAKYSDFGPTLAQEKLTELHGLSLSVETLRVWMMEDGIWVSRSKRARRRRHEPANGATVCGVGIDVRLLRGDSQLYRAAPAQQSRCAPSGKRNGEARGDLHAARAPTGQRRADAPLQARASM